MTYLGWHPTKSQPKTLRLQFLWKQKNHPTLKPVKKIRKTKTVGKATPQKAGKRLRKKQVGGTNVYTLTLSGDRPLHNHTIFPKSWENFRRRTRSELLQLFPFVASWEASVDLLWRVDGLWLGHTPYIHPLRKNATQPILFLKMKGDVGPFFWLVGLYDVEENTYNTEVVQVDDGIFCSGRWHDFHVRFQGGEISFRKYDWLQIAVPSHHLKVHDASWCLLCFFGWFLLF